MSATIAEEAIHGAVRIANLVGYSPGQETYVNCFLQARVLTTNEYLRLDPNVLHFAIYSAGVALARLGKKEAIYCVDGLKQYGAAFEDALDQADEIHRIYKRDAAQRVST